jgi:uncharacterized integral membrane protein
MVSFVQVKGKDDSMSSDPYVTPEPPVVPAATPVAPPPPSAPTPTPQSAVKFTRAAALWSALIVGFIILIVLLVFIAQNTDSAQFTFLGWHWSLPLGVAILMAAVLGGLIAVLAGTARIVQLRRAAKTNLKAGL